MSKFLRYLLPAAVLAAPALTVAGMAAAESDRFGLGRAALPAEIAAWDKDVSPDGTGLPAGSGSVLDGEEIFADYCAICHGDFAEGIDNWPKLAGGVGTLDYEDPTKTVGSYWPYLTTTWDYVNRSMPFGNAQTLDTDQVYAIVAYILYSNDLVDEDFVLTKENLLDVELPNRDGFIVDDRPKTEYAIWTGEPCMENCKDSVEITMRARVLDVTPEESRARRVQELIRATKPRPQPDEAADEPVETAAVAPDETSAIAADPALVAAGEKVFRKCKACHQVGKGAKNRTGPVLNGVMGRAASGVEGFKYSKAFAELAEDGVVWTDETLAEFLSNPKAFAKGTRMSFKGLNKPEDLAAIAAYLASFPE